MTDTPHTYLRPGFVPNSPGEVRNPTGRNGYSHPRPLRDALNRLLRVGEGANAKRIAQRLVSIATGEQGTPAESIAATKIIDAIITDSPLYGSLKTDEGTTLLRTIRVVDVTYNEKLEYPPIPGLVIDVDKVIPKTLPDGPG